MVFVSTRYLVNEPRLILHGKYARCRELVYLIALLLPRYIPQTHAAAELLRALPGVRSRTLRENGEWRTFDN